MENERKAFEEAIRENPYDWTARKIFADWLSEHGHDDEAAIQYKWTPEWQQSADWLTKFARDITEEYEYQYTGEASVVTLEQVVLAGRAYNERRDYSCLSGMGYQAEGLMEDREVAEAFWHHWEVYTGEKADDFERVGTVFSCSC